MHKLLYQVIAIKEKYVKNIWNLNSNTQFVSFVFNSIKLCKRDQKMFEII